MYPSVLYASEVLTFITTSDYRSLEFVLSIAAAKVFCNVIRHQRDAFGLAPWSLNEVIATMQWSFHTSVVQFTPQSGLISFLSTLYRLLILNVFDCLVLFFTFVLVYYLLPVWQNKVIYL
jgi:hypothetical protein